MFGEPFYGGPLVTAVLIMLGVIAAGVCIYYGTGYAIARLAGSRQHGGTGSVSLRPVFVDCEQEGWLDPLIDPDLAAAWMRFEDQRAPEPVRIASGGRRATARLLSVADQRAQSELYPGLTPLREVTGRGGDAA